MITDLEMLVILDQKQILYINDTDHIVRGILINRNSGVPFFPV